MARTKDPKAAKELGTNLMRLWTRKEPAMSTLEHALYARGVQADRETIRLYHDGQRDPANIDIAVAVAIADYYRVDVAKLHPSFKARAVMAGALFAGYAPRDSNPEPADVDLVQAEQDELALNFDSTSQAA